MITSIKDYNLDDINNSIHYLLSRSANSIEVRQHAVNISYDKEDKIAAIYDWVKNNVHYQPDPCDIELFISPVRMVKDYQEGKVLSGDCDDMALIATGLYRALGIPSDVVIVDQTGYGYDHAFSRAYSTKLNRYITVDPSSNFPLGWEIRYRNRLIVGG